MAPHTAFMDQQPLTSQELSLLRVLHAELDEHRQKRTLTIDEYAKANHKVPEAASASVSRDGNGGCVYY